ncbi:cuticle protein 18.6-like [Wyeomyia smithii]|uniref:cuticle protein 18.6-like n=1 Tax=Wyeomyia smithii TaxID=174621 RepID=UPI002467F461|nr:cuticle protein 18.6-like [Wyeomyia smithii]
MFAKIIFFCVLAIASICAKPQFPLAYSSPLLANPAVAVASPYAAAYTAPVAAAYTAASAPLTAAYPSAYAGYPYAAYNSVFL